MEIFTFGVYSIQTYRTHVQLSVMGVHHIEAARGKVCCPEVSHMTIQWGGVGWVVSLCHVTIGLQARSGGGEKWT